MTDGSGLRPFRPDPPCPDEMVRWPASFGTRFLVFCDVEEEFDWRAPLTREAFATTAMAAFPDAHRRFADLGIPLTCMVDYPIATDPRSVAILARAIEDGRSAIGAQLHPWVTPPFDEPLTPPNSYAGNLPHALEAAKIDTLTGTLTTAFGRQPIAYRAGRYGLGPQTLRLLSERGYRLDSSIRARYDYRSDGGPDYRDIDNAVFRRNNVMTVPFTTVFTGGLHRHGAFLHRLAGRVPHGPGALARARLVNRVSLTPEEMPLVQTLDAVRRTKDNGLRLLAFSFHSPSLTPGHTPYVRTAADLDAFWRWWTEMAAHLCRLGIHPASLDEVLAGAE